MKHTKENLSIRARLASRAAVFLALIAICLACVPNIVNPTFAYGAAYDLGPGAPTFSAPVTLTAPDNTTSQINCTFAIVDDMAHTCAVYGDGTESGPKAIGQQAAGSIDIPETVSFNGTAYTVVAVSSYAFGGARTASCDQLTSVSLPDTVTAIGKHAFSFCSGLKQSVLTDTITYVGPYAFYYCSSIDELEIPSSVETLGAYAFSQAGSLTTVRFLGDVPENFGKYAFTGASMGISKVIFSGASYSQGTWSDYFNGPAAESPTFYYTIRFYGNKDDATTAQNEIGQAVISQKVKYKDIHDTLSTGQGLLEGSVPAYPEGTNMWKFVDAGALHFTIDRSTAAYPIYSRYRELNVGGTATFSDCSYTGEPLQPTLKVYATTNNMNRLVQPERTLFVRDSNGTELDYEKDFTLTYNRQDENGLWQPTEDLTSPGTIKIVITGAGWYTGTIEKTFDITFEAGATFVADVPLLKGGNTQSTVKCAFKVVTINEDGTGTVTVARKLPTKEQEAANEMQRAVPISTGGELFIPETIEAAGITFTVTSIDGSAFGKADKALRQPTCSQLWGVRIPKTIKYIGSTAFGFCYGLKQVVFEGDASSISITSDLLAGCNLDTVVFLGKKPDPTLHILNNLFPGRPNYFYTITFYESLAAYNAHEAPCGSITLRDDVKLAFVPDKPTDPEKVFTGSVPDYPSWVIDDHNNPDRSYYAPTWMYPEVDLDNIQALGKTLTDSVYAYAEQMQDAFSLEDILVFGLKDGYDYSGEPVLDPSDISVCSFCGGTLTPQVDYEVSFERLTDDDVWEPTEDLIKGGQLRVVIRGLGKYQMQTRRYTQEFTIITHESRVGTEFTAPVSLVNKHGETTIPCKFVVTSIGEGRSCKIN